MTQTSLPKVAILATGGTIAGRAGSSLSHEYKAGSATGAELVDAVPELARVAEVQVEQVCNIASSNMVFEVWRALAARIDALFSGDPELAGIVVTHGTNTLEETAYFLNLTVRHDRPVVLVGSQRPATALSPDGPLNLVNAVRVAACPDSRDRGVLVMLNDEINAARDVTKTNTYRVETFRSGDLGFIGYADADRVAYYRRPEKRHTVDSEFATVPVGALPKVEIVYGYVESDARVVIDALRAAGTRGFVFTGTGAGMLSDVEKEIVAQSQARGDGIVFVRSNRLGNGRVLAHGEHDELGIVPADNLNPQKARILLMCALARTHDLAEIRRIFAQY
ncbi:MAG: asparaginase [Rhodocyclaceae bacterium]|nr:asparaginase [Rhodocyclaceae bacterium]MCA3107649.1 asparaginase [Rhodocyclaceae bacterium]